MILHSTDKYTGCRVQVWRISGFCGYGDSMGIPTGFFSGYGMGMGIKIQSPRQPFCLSLCHINPKKLYYRCCDTMRRGKPSSPCQDVNDRRRRNALLEILNGSLSTLTAALSITSQGVILAARNTMCSLYHSHVEIL